MAKRSVFWVLLAAWTVGAIVGGHAIKDDIGGRFQEEWFLCTAFILCGVALLAVFLQWVRQLAVKARELPAGQTFPDNPGAANPVELVQGMLPMSDKPKVIIQSPGNVTINHNTTHNNVQGGIIGSGTVTVHQHFDKTQPSPPPPETQSTDPVLLIPAKETANLDELQVYVEKLLGKAIAENTVRKILERAEVESCGEEIRGRARPKLYPREQAEKALADYAIANKEK